MHGWSKQEEGQEASVGEGMEVDASKATPAEQRMSASALVGQMQTTQAAEKDVPATRASAWAGSQGEEDDRVSAIMGGICTIMRFAAGFQHANGKKHFAYPEFWLFSVGPEPFRWTWTSPGHKKPISKVCNMCQQADTTNGQNTIQQSKLNSARSYYVSAASSQEQPMGCSCGWPTKEMLRFRFLFSRSSSQMQREQDSSNKLKYLTTARVQAISG